MFATKLMLNASNPVEICSLAANPNLQIFAKSFIMYYYQHSINNILRTYMHKDCIIPSKIQICHNNFNTQNYENLEIRYFGNRLIY